MPFPEYVPVDDIVNDLAPDGTEVEKEEEQASQGTPKKQKAGTSSTKGRVYKPKGTPSQDKNKNKRQHSDEEEDVDALKNKRSRKTSSSTTQSHESPKEGFFNADDGETHKKQKQQQFKQQQQQQQQKQQTETSLSLLLTMGSSEARLIKSAGKGKIWQPQWQVRDTHSLYKGDLKKDVAVELAKAFQLPVDAPPIPDVNMPPSVLASDAIMLMGQSLNPMRAVYDLSNRLWDELNETRGQLQEAQKQMADCITKEQFLKHEKDLKSKLATEKTRWEKAALEKFKEETDAFQANAKAEADKFKKDLEESLQRAFDEELQKATDAEVKKALAEQASAHKEELEKIDAKWNILYAKVANDVKIAADKGYHKCLEVVKPIVGDITPFLPKGAKKPPKGDPNKPNKDSQGQQQPKK